MAPSVFHNRTPKRIGIVGFYGKGNLGDETVVAILVKKIREHYPNAEVSGFSLDPTDTEWRHGIKAFPIRWNSDPRVTPQEPRLSSISQRAGLFRKLKQRLKKWPVFFKPLKTLKELGLWSCYDLPFFLRSLHRLRGFDLLIVPGSGPFTDWWGGPSSHPGTLLSWGVLARLTRTKVIALSIGCERLNTWLGMRFCKWFLSIACYRSFRDNYSRDTMKTPRLNANDPVFPDQGFAVLDVFGIDSTASAKMEADGAGQGLVIGVCPVGKGCCVDLGEDDSSYQRYRKILGAFLACLIRKGYRLAFCHTDINDLPLMYELVDDITRACPGTDVPRRIMQDPIVSTEDLIARIESCDMIVASRFHGVVLPIALQKPVLALSAYGRKIGDVMSQLGQAAYYLEARKADVGHLIKVFQALEQNRHSIAQHLEAVAPDLRSALNKQYDEVFERFKRQSDVTRRRNTAGVPGVYIQDTAPGAPARGACGQAGTNRVSSPAAIGGARAYARR